jgi:SAM-dependent methyltransferase
MKDLYGYELTGGHFVKPDKIITDNKKKLNFGSGNDIRKGWDNADRLPLPGVNTVFDFNKFPYPIKDNTYDYILAKVVLEHLIDPKMVLYELHRICKHKAIIEIIVPYWNNYTAYSDVEHIHGFNDMAFSFTHLKMENEFNIKEVKLVPSLTGRFFLFRRFFSHYICGLIKQIYVRLEVKK